MPPPWRLCWPEIMTAGCRLPGSRSSAADATITNTGGWGLSLTTDQIASRWPRAQEFGFASEMEAFALQFGHGLGLALHERPIISRLVSFDDPIEIQEGMVFALETYCPATDGHSAARIEEEVVVTRDGCRVITLFPAQELFVTNPY